MRIDDLSRIQEKRINEAADHLLTRFDNCPHALIFKGSAILHDDAPDVDVIIVTDNEYKNKIGSKEYVRKDMQQILRREDGTGHDYFDIRFITPEDLEERVLSLHTDSFDRVAFTDLAYHIHTGKEFLRPLEQKMYQCIWNDFLQYLKSSEIESEVNVSMQSLIMYPLMLDLRRISTIVKSAYRFISSENTEKNVSTIIAEILDTIKIPKGVERTDYGIAINIEDLKIDSRSEIIPSIAHTYEREFPDRYDVILKVSPPVPDLSHITHFKEKDNKLFYTPQIRRLINSYAQ
jgi:hypothetical protein